MRYRLGAVPLLVHRLGGRATWQQLEQHSTQHHVRQAVRNGEILRVASGIYVLPTLPDERIAAARARGAVCLQTAARTWQLPTLQPPADLQVAVPPGARPPTVPGVRYRWCRLTEDEVRHGRTELQRTVLDCAAVLPLPEALTIADAALQLDLLGRDDLIEAAQRLGGPGRARRLRVLRAADAGAASPLESALRAILLAGGIKGFVTQLLVPAGPWATRVDLGDPRRKIALEADGYQFHATSRRAFTRDLTRNGELARSGWVVLRFSWEQVMFQPDWTLTLIRDVVSSRSR